MAQFEVYPNTNKATKAQYPYLLDIQSEFISELNTRLVIPIGYVDSFGGAGMNKLTPVVYFDDKKLLVMTPQLASIPKKLLTEPMGSLEHMRTEILNAIDFALAGY